MQIVQRALLIMTMIIVLMVGTIVICREKEEKLQKQWECVQTERFLGKICRNGSISLDEYMEYNTTLNHAGTVSKIRIEEYQREQDITGRNYYYLVSWEELQDCFMKEGACDFKTESVIKISVEQKSMGQSMKNSYYGVIYGKE